MSAMVPESLVPRKYQEEIFTQAMHENIIAALDTGSGKTYIAVLLMRWMAAQYTGPRKIYAFIVPKVPLVEQQKNFISEQIPLTVRGYYGELVDRWQHDPAKWAQEFNECDIMVMTAQVFLDAMLHAHWSIDQVALIVFDEAHHTRKNHPYNQIMRDFYFRCDEKSRPKILGMTASPVWNSKQPWRSLEELQANLAAKVVGVLENQAELSEHSPKPQESIREYPLQSTYPTYPTSLFQQLVALDLVSYLHIGKENPELRYSVTLEELGPYCGDFYLVSHLTRLVSELSRKDQYKYLAAQDKMSSIAMDAVHGDFEVMSVDSDATGSSSRLILLEEILENFNDTISFDETFALDSRWLSPKLRTLVSILLERRSTSFQGIVFVEQRQVASTLSWILPRIPELKGWITTGALVGHGSGTGSTPETQGMMEKKQREILNSFRDGSRNLLISTSVGEEGLDFQACDLIVRYDRIQNMVAYLQSRGRARRPDSTYIVMIPEGSLGDRMQYDSLRGSEPELKDYYQNHNRREKTKDEEEEQEMPADIALRERYEIPSTGAVLTFGSAISMLNNLCALIPRDKYTQVLQPNYHMDEKYFMATVELPSALPIPRDQLLFEGTPRSTKREAKASAAFVACKELHRLEVFDDYLLPARKTSGEIIEDADGRLIPEVGAVSEMIDVSVVDPWRAWYLPGDENTVTSDAWIHAIWVNCAPQASMGIVTANPLDGCLQLSCEYGNVQIGAPTKLSWPSADAAATLTLLHEYTKLALFWCNTSKSIKSQMTCFLVPLVSGGQPDFDAIELAVRNPTCRDYNITHEHEDHLLLQNRLESGRPLILRRLREDLTPLSRVDSSDGSTPECETYAELFQKYYGRSKQEVFIPLDGPMLLVETYVRNFSSQYALYPSPAGAPAVQFQAARKKQYLLPAGLAEVSVLPEHAQQAFRVFPQIVRRITDVYRAREAVTQLRLPSLINDLVIESLTLPCATAGFNNQRLETLGDSVLKLSVVVYLFNKYPFRHEGQLDGMRKNSVSNRVLLARAKEVGLESFLTSEPSAVRKWKPSTADGTFVNGVWKATRRFARRSLQDCMEALLGVSFLTGGINMALYTGTSLQLCFGGTDPWNVRYSPREQTPIPALFGKLPQDIGYNFKCGQLLIEAVTHPSLQSSNSCYQRLEFLGDALIDLIVMEFLFKKFPAATSGQLSWARSRAVCAPALTTLAVKQLSLHKYLLANRVELGKAIAHSVPVHSRISFEDIVLEGWKYEPPKALSDIMESVVGAIFVDTNFDYDRTKGIVLKIMQPLLDVLRPNLPRDPTTELMLSLARRGCCKAKFERFASEPEKSNQNDSIRFRVHGTLIGSAYRTTNGLMRAKPFLAQKVKQLLEDPISPFYLENLCNCKAAAAAAKVSSDLSDVDREALDDEKEEEFAVLSILQLQDVDGVLEVLDPESDEELDDQEEEEVDKMIY